MADQTGRHINTIQLEPRLHLEASGVEPSWFNPHLQLITAVQRPQEIGFAMHHRQRGVGPMVLAACSRKDAACCNSVSLEAFFPGFMAPAQQLMEMHHAGGVGVAEAHVPLELEPVVGGGHGLWKSRRQDEAGNPSMPSNPYP